MSQQQENDSIDQSDVASQGTMTPKSTVTISSSGVDSFFREDGDRKYHASETVYSLPSDDQEVNRLNLQHMIHQRLLGDRNYPERAPVHETLMNLAVPRRKRILDVGTGSGIWAIEMALEFPFTEVVGVDVVPIQPREVPPNVTFEIDDLNKPWLARDNGRYDLIHSRAVTFGVKDWAEYVGGVVASLAPGGLCVFIEPWDWLTISKESDGITENLNRWSELFKRLVEAKGAQGAGARTLYPILEAHPDLYDVSKETIDWPIGPRRGDQFLSEIGIWFAQDIGAAISLVSPLLAEDGHNDAYISNFLSKVTKELWDDRKEARWTWAYTWARKKKTAAPASDED